MQSISSWACLLHSLRIKGNSPDSSHFVFYKDFVVVVDTKSVCGNTEVEGISPNSLKGFNTKYQEQVKRKPHKYHMIMK